jgi:anti-sigma B factor antagonist
MPTATRPSLTDPRMQQKSLKRGPRFGLASAAGQPPRGSAPVRRPWPLATPCLALGEDGGETARALLDEARFLPVLVQHVQPVGGGPRRPPRRSRPLPRGSTRPGRSWPTRACHRDDGPRTGLAPPAWRLPSTAPARPLRPNPGSILRPACGVHRASGGPPRRAGQPPAARRWTGPSRAPPAAGSWWATLWSGAGPSEVPGCRLTASGRILGRSAPLLAGMTAMPQFDLSATTEGEWAVLAVSGEVDLATAPALRECLGELAAGGVRHVVVDLRQVSFLDSIGLGVLIAASRRLRGGEPAGSLRLVCTNERIVKLFVLTGLLGMFPMYASVEQARAAGDPRAPGPSGQSGGAWPQGGGGQPPRQERPRPPQDRQARCGVAGQGGRAGHVPASFVPPAPIRRLRDLTRYRARWSASGPGRPSAWPSSWRTPRSSCRVWQATSSGCRAGRCSRRWSGGQRDPKVLAQLARASMCQAPPARGGPDRAVRRPSRVPVPDGAGTDRRADQPDRGAGRTDRRAGRSVRGPSRPAGCGDRHRTGLRPAAHRASSVRTWPSSRPPRT